ncbi:MAG: hypothetical protein ABSF65_05810 [Candidatus Bathyarchaeia archaeon]
MEKEYTPLTSFTQNTGEVPAKLVAKALLGASVTTQDPEFDKKYETAVKAALEKYKLKQPKRIYKSAHLLKQIKGRYDEVFTSILNAMEKSIIRIDVYHATYLHDNPDANYVSIYGKAQGERLTPLDYIEKHRNGFDQACAWWNWREYSAKEPDTVYCLDHFDSKMTPGWTEFEKSGSKINVYYSGAECNCLISLADLILKEIDDFHFGPIDYISVIMPIRRRANYPLLQKIRSFNLSKTDLTIRETVPELPFEIDLNQYIKHPTYFIAWTPNAPRKTVKPSFEFSKFYNTVMSKALDTDGCVKLLDFDRDMTFWDESDFIVPWEALDIEHVKQLQSMGFNDMPKILNATDLTT